MIGLGTIVNVLAIIAGGLAGLVAIIVMALGSTLSQMFVVNISVGADRWSGSLDVQGTITLLAKEAAPVMTEAAVGNLALVGNVLILCVGVNLIWPKTIRVANVLPAIVIAMIFTLF